MGSARSHNATVAGTAMSKTFRAAQARVRANASDSARVFSAESVGNITVAMAMAKIPKGSSVNLSE